MAIRGPIKLLIDRNVQAHGVHIEPAVLEPHDSLRQSRDRTEHIRVARQALSDGNAWLGVE